MGSFGDFKIEWETRLCEVDGIIGYFHTWEQWSKPLPASPLAGGPPAGVISMVFGIVEFPEGVKRVDPTSIKFVDEINSGLTIMNARKKEKENDHNCRRNNQRN